LFSFSGANRNSNLKLNISKHFVGLNRKKWSFVKDCLTAYSVMVKKLRRLSRCLLYDSRQY